jgi:hypothetical protein
LEHERSPKNKKFPKSDKNKPKANGKTNQQDVVSWEHSERNQKITEKQQKQNECVNLIKSENKQDFQAWKQWGRNKKKKQENKQLIRILHHGPSVMRKKSALICALRLK